MGRYKLFCDSQISWKHIPRQVNVIETQVITPQLQYLMLKKTT
jgi:hypothetical protein